MTVISRINQNESNVLLAASGFGMVLAGSGHSA